MGKYIGAAKIAVVWGFDLSPEFENAFESSNITPTLPKAKKTTKSQHKLLFNQGGEKLTWKAPDERLFAVERLDAARFLIVFTNSILAVNDAYEPAHPLGSEGSLQAWGGICNVRALLHDTLQELATGTTRRTAQ